MSGPVRGEVWWGETVAHGRRPYIVLTRDEAIEQLAEVIVVPLATTVRGLPNEVELDEADGLPRACVTRLDRTEISLLERAGREPRLTTMVKLARALDVSLAELLAGVG